MKTTIDLPPDLVREMKLIAVNEGKKLKDVASDLLKRGLQAGKKKPARTSKDFFLTASPKSPPMTPNMVRKILEDAP